MVNQKLTNKIKELIKERNEQLKFEKNQVKRWQITDEVDALESGVKLINWIEKLQSENWRDFAEKNAKSIKKYSDRTFYKSSRFEELKEVWENWKKLGESKLKSISELADWKKRKQQLFWKKDKESPLVKSLKVW